MISVLVEGIFLKIKIPRVGSIGSLSEESSKDPESKEEEKESVSIDLISDIIFQTFLGANPGYIYRKGRLHAILDLTQEDMNKINTQEPISIKITLKNGSFKEQVINRSEVGNVIKFKQS